MSKQNYKRRNWKKQIMKIKFLLWRWFVCPWRVYYHLLRWPNKSAAVQYIRKNTKWPLKKCAKYVDNKYGKYVWDLDNKTINYHIWG